MKKIKILTAISLMILIWTMPVFAGDETLFSGNVEHGGFGGPVVKFTQIKDEFGVLVGGRGGWIINHSFVLGAGGYGLVNENIDVRRFGNDSTTYLTMGYGGVEMEYMCRPSRLMHMSFQTLIGAGWAGYCKEYSDNYPEYDNNDSPRGDRFFVFEPGINIELNVVTFFRTDLGASYRVVSGINSDRLKNSDIAGPSLNIAFKFGKF
jgi:hypothetical protein